VAVLEAFSSVRKKLNSPESRSLFSLYTPLRLLILGLLLVGALGGCNYRELKGQNLKMKGTGRVPTYAEVRAAVLVPECLNCHGGKETKMGFDVSTYAGTHKKIRTGDRNPSHSQLWTMIESGDMPDMSEPGMSPESDISAAQKQLVYDWIAGGAPETAASPGGGTPGGGPGGKSSHCSKSLFFRRVFDGFGSEMFRVSWGGKTSRQVRLLHLRKNHGEWKSES